MSIPRYFAIVTTAMEIFPWGAPQRRLGWRRPDLLTGSSKYQVWLKEVFGRTVPTPISDIFVFRSFGLAMGSYFYSEQYLRIACM